MKPFAGTLATVALLGALAGYYFWVDVPQEKRKLQETQDSARVVPYLLDKVRDFTYQHGDLTIHAVKDDLTWKLKEPLESLADHMTVNGMLQELESTRHMRVVEESPKDLAPFGLKKPAITLTLKDKTFGEQTVMIGDESPIGHSAYFKTADNPRVLLVPGFRKNWIKTLYDFRDKTLLRFVPEAINAITFTRPQNVLKMEKTGDVWTLSEPIQAMGDKDAIGDLVSKLKHARVEAFVEEAPGGLEPYGLDTPQYTIQFSDGKDNWQLQLGSAKSPTQIHAKLKRQANVVLVETKLKEWIETSHLDLIDKRILTFEENDIVQIDLSEASGQLRLVRGKGDDSHWVIEGVEKAEADQAVINSLLFDLGDARALEFLSFGTPENFGLKSPKKTLTLKNKQGEAQSISLGNSNLAGQQSFLSRSLDKGVFVLGQETVEKIFRPLETFQDRRLIQLDDQKAQRILLEYPDQTFELTRKDNQWDLIRPEKIEGLQAYIGNDILWTLNNLRFEKEITSPTPEQKNIASPALKVTVFDAANNTLTRVQVAPPSQAEQHVVALVKGHPHPIQIASRFLDEVPHEIEKFRKSKKD